jgi:hypothetical protein
MIPPLPPNYAFSLLAVPVWRWEETPVLPAEPAACTEAAADATGGAVPASIEKRLVFAGYEWVSQVQWTLFPDAPWEHGFEDQTGEIRDGALREEHEQRLQQQQHAKASGDHRAASVAAAADDRLSQGSAPPSDDPAL